VAADSEEGDERALVCQMQFFAVRGVWRVESGANGTLCVATLDEPGSAGVVGGTWFGACLVAGGSYDACMIRNRTRT
jgi:hypothetical protein